MLRTVSLLIILALLSGCAFANQIVDRMSDPLIFSPSGRFTAQLTTYAQPYNFAFSEFTVYDSQTYHLSHQLVYRLPVPYGTPSGVSFDWTPSEHYLFILTDELASSHGCDELFVYTGNGSHLVFNSAKTTSLCRSIEADASIEIIVVCPNDDIFFYQSGTYRLTPSTGTYTTLPSIADAKC